MTQLSSVRKSVLAGIILGLFLIYGLKLFSMQIVFNRKFEDKSTDNSIKAIEQMPLRGVFYDRNLKLLVQNVPSYTVRITPSEYDTLTNPMLEALLQLPKDTISHIMQKHKKYGKYQPVKIKKGASFEEIGWLEENSERFPGVDYIIEIKRGYTNTFSAAHVLGYLKETNENDLKKDSFYTLGDNLGMNGIEKSYEKELRGEKGFNYILVNATRRKIGRYKDGTVDLASIKGKDLVLSLDSGAQATAEQVMHGRSGAIIAIEPSSGEILAFTSAPDYDLSKFSDITP
nr:penicillin-binding protein 2 [Ignavibacteriaceae bacterium]